MVAIVERGLSCTCLLYGSDRGREMSEGAAHGFVRVSACVCSGELVVCSAFAKL